MSLTRLTESALLTVNNDDLSMYVYECDVVQTFVRLPIITLITGEKQGI